jgi:hypothetical protein
MVLMTSTSVIQTLFDNSCINHHAIFYIRALIPELKNADKSAAFLKWAYFVSGRVQ